MACWLMISRPGGYTREALILGNPEAVKDNFTPAAVSWSLTPDLTFEEGFDKRLLSVVADTEVQVLQCTAGETPNTPGLVPTTIPAPASAKVSYSCFVHPGTVTIHVRTP